MAVLPSRERSSDEPQRPGDFLPRNLLHEKSRWAHRNILAILGVFHRPKDFYLDYDGSATSSDGRDVRMRLIPLDRKWRRHLSSGYYTVNISVLDSFLRISVSSPDSDLKLKKEWRYGSKHIDRYRRKPKWRKFGAHIIFRLQQYHRLQIVEGVMES